MREFSEHMFRHVSFLKGYADNLDVILEDWKSYKLCVPTYGAIIMDDQLDNVLLVQSYYSKSSWGFPKGKVNEDEQPHDCAVREVLEETGFDISGKINPDAFLQTIINDQQVWLYLIPGVPKDTVFAPRTKCEIREIKWFPVADLPNSKNGNQNFQLNPNSLYMVLPFVK